MANDAQWRSVVVEVGKLTQKDIVAAAKGLHAIVMRDPPRPTSYVRHVDGKVAPEEAVKLGGIIVYDYNRMDLAKKRALEILEEFSPVLDGDYKRSHRIVMDTPEEVRITNTLPYSRVIEVGKRGKVVLKFRNGGAKVYDKTARKINRDPTIGGGVKARMSFTESAGPTMGNSREARRAAQWPTLILTAE